MKSLTCRLAMAMALAAIPAAAHAQTQYDANCQPSEPSEDQLFQQEICKSHAGCAIVVSAGQGFCKGVDFFRNIGDQITGPKPLTNDDVIEVVELDYPKSTFTSRIMEKVESVTAAVFGSKPELQTFAIGDGSKFAYSETLPSGAGQRAGAIVYSDGSAARGRFNDSFVNNGIGEQVSATGQVKAGEFRNSVLSGEGFKTEGNGRNLEMYEGTFDNDVPVGEVVHRFADGTSARELWQNGKMIERGLLAARGEIPPHLASRLAETLAAPNELPVKNAPSNSSAVSAGANLSGLWTGQSSGNQVNIQMQSGGFAISVPGQRRSGQYGEGQFFRDAGSGLYLFTKPDGNNVKVQVLGPDRIRVTNPDGWTDDFSRR